MTLLNIKKLEKSYGEKKVLSNISFDIKPGEIVGLIGKNGAGKTTILKSISGLISYDSGEIKYKNKEISQNRELIQEFGILLECAFLDYISAYDNLKIQGLADVKKVNKNFNKEMEDVLRLVDLYDVRKKKTKSYSFGMKQRLGLAQAILTGKGLLILDEPFIGLDPIGKEIVKTTLSRKAKEENLGVLFSSHDLPDVADICDRVIMLENGQCNAVDTPLLQASYVFHLKKKISEKMILTLPVGAKADVSRKMIYFIESSLADYNEININNLLSFITENNLIITGIRSGDEVLKELFQEKE